MFNLFLPLLNNKDASILLRKLTSQIVCTHDGMGAVTSNLAKGGFVNGTDTFGRLTKRVIVFTRTKVLYDWKKNNLSFSRVFRLLNASEVSIWNENSKNKFTLKLYSSKRQFNRLHCNKILIMYLYTKHYQYSVLLFI